MGKSWKEGKGRSNKFDRYASKKKNKNVKHKSNKPKFDDGSGGSDWEDWLKKELDVWLNYGIVIHMSKTFKKNMPKIRKSWGEMNPATRRVESHKRYVRHDKWRKCLDSND